MLAGGLRQRIKVFTRQSITTQSGAEELQYVHILTTWAQTLNRNASLREEINQRFGGNTVQINVRAEHPIKVEDRISFEKEPDITYVVTERVPNFQHGMNTFTLMEIHE